MDRAEGGRSGSRTMRRRAVAAGRGRSGRGPAQRRGVRTGHLQSPGNRRGGRAAPPPVPFRTRGPSRERRGAGAQGQRPQACRLGRARLARCGAPYRDNARHASPCPRGGDEPALRLPCGYPNRPGRPSRGSHWRPACPPPATKLGKHTPRPTLMNSVIAYHSQHLQMFIKTTAARPSVSAILDRTARRRLSPSRPYAVRGNTSCAGSHAPPCSAGAGRPHTSRTGRAPLKADPVDGDSRHAPTSAPTVRPRYAGPAGPAPSHLPRKRGLAGLAPTPPAKIPWARMTVWTVGGASS